jgi:hypothetical protein
MIRALCALVFLTLAVPAVARADSAEDRQALVVLRLLSYDRELARKERKVVVVGVVHDDRDAASRRSATAIADALRARARSVTVADRPVAVVEIAADRLLEDRLRDLRVDAMFVASGLDRELPDLTRAARLRPCLTFGATPAYLRRGIAIALGSDDPQRRVTIWIDLEESRRQGARLSAELLRVSRVLRR